ncbi:hypothetical protein BH23ACT11_BH23ACT11_17680 [soil metagenome]
MQPDSTNLNAYGLSPQQEQAAALLTSGLSVQEVADRLDIHRTTLWHWRKLETFDAYVNTLRSDAQAQTAEGILSLQRKAVETVERLLESESDGTALRAAALVLAASQAQPTGQTDPRRLIRDRANAESDQLMWATLIPGAGDETYRHRCKELGIEP